MRGFQPYLIPYFELSNWDWIFVGGFIDGSDCLCTPLSHYLEASFYRLIVCVHFLIRVEDGSIPQQYFTWGCAQSGIDVVVVHCGGYGEPSAPISLLGVCDEV